MFFIRLRVKRRKEESSEKRNPHRCGELPATIGNIVIWKRDSFVQSEPRTVVGTKTNEREPREKIFLTLKTVQSYNGLSQHGVLSSPRDCKNHFVVERIQALKVELFRPVLLQL